MKARIWKKRFNKPWLESSQGFQWTGLEPSMVGATISVGQHEKDVNTVHVEIKMTIDEATDFANALLRLVERAKYFSSGDK